MSTVAKALVGAIIAALATALTIAQQTNPKWNALAYLTIVLAFFVSFGGVWITPNATATRTTNTTT